LADERGLGGERVARGVPALPRVMSGAGRAQDLRVVERKTPDELLGRLRLRSPAPAHDGPGPRLSESAVAVRHEALRVAQALPERPSRPRFGAPVPLSVDPGHDRRHDERAEARPEAVLVDPDADGLPSHRASVTTAA